jgi:hypothetical protein
MDQAAIEPIDHADVERELAEAIARTERLGDAIEACLDDVERELEDIRRINPALAAS